MEFSFSDEPKKASAPATKMYSPKKRAGKESGGGSDDRAQETGAAVTPGARGKRGRRTMSTGSRIGIMFSSFLFAGMLLFTLTGYERISRAYADVNTINREIESTQLRIKALDVQIECAVTIQDAQETAERYGMRYPTQSQYVKIGSSIPVFGQAPADDNPGNTIGPDETPTGNDTQAPEDDNPPADDTPSDD